MDLQGKNVTVVGLGVSGLAAAELACRLGAVTRITEAGDSPEIRERAEGLRARGVTTEIGGHSVAFLEGAEILVVSPGVEDSSPPVEWAKTNGITIIGELEFGFRFCKNKIIAISGTNGKSTVTSLIGEMFSRAGKAVSVCGNIGTPFTSVVTDLGADETVILEVSSFQLERTSAFKPYISILLNITEDHLDRHSGFDKYIEAKLMLFKNQDSGDFAILNNSETRLRNIKESLSANVLYFSKHRLSKEYDGAYLENGELVTRLNGKYVWLASEDSLSLKGEHNLENSAAAGLAAFISGIDPEVINEVLGSFKTLDHRFQFIGLVGGVRFIDDSKATNVDSTYRAIQSSPKGIVLIAGGKDKGGDYKHIAKSLREKVKSVILIGEARERIASAFSGIIPALFAEDLRAAVSEAFKRSKSGDTVLLSPMCSSFDMFRDYKERGEVFQQAVDSLRKK